MRNQCKIETQGGRLCETTRTAIADAIRALPDGLWRVTFERTYAYKGRYRYYYGYLLPEIIHRLKLMVRDNDGVLVSMDEKQAHEMFKRMFCTVYVRNPITCEMERVTVSTTTLSDADFIEQYEDDIMRRLAETYPDEFSEGILSRSEWVAIQKAKHKAMELE